MQRSRGRVVPQLRQWVAIRGTHAGRPARVPALATNSSTRPLAVSWLSPNDKISRKAFAGDIQQAWALLQVCLEQNKMERAESVLLGLTEICSDDGDVVLAVNVYLNKFVELHAGTPTMATDWLRKIRLSVPGFRPSEVTEAILLKNAWLGNNPEVLSAYIQERGFDQWKLCKILRHTEVLGADAVRAVVGASNVSFAELDRRTKHFLDEAEHSPTLSKTAEPEMLASPIPKGNFGELMPTESAGLRSIRHVLTALRPAQQDFKKLWSLPLIQDKHPEKGDYIDFFEIWKKLEEDPATTSEDIEALDKLLNEINLERQRNIETRGVEAARMKWQAIFERMAEADHAGGNKVNLRGLETLLWQWNQAMLPLVRAEIEKLKLLTEYKSVSEIPKNIRNEFDSATLADKFDYAPYLVLAQPENLPAMTMMELLRLNSTRGANDGVRSVKAVLNVGKNVELEYHLGSLRDSSSRRKSDSAKPQLNVRTAISNGEIQSWPMPVRAKIGSLLISLFMKVARIPVTGTDPETGALVRGQSPAFHHSYQYQNGNKVGVLRPHKVVARYLSGETTAAIVQPQLLPMLVEPRPWTSWDQGGYLHSPSKLVRSRGAPEQTAYIKAASEAGQLQPVFDGLNVLGRTPWTINKPLFKVISEIWNSQAEFQDIPPHVAPQPDLSDMVIPSRNADPEERRDYLRECRRRTLENGRLYSQRCDLNYKLDIARAFLGERFYMPHNLDFRGRAYPLSPHLNHLGNDVSRSLLQFWNGRKLGERGLFWLKVHLANLYGVSKASHSDRVSFVESHMEDILDSARDPLKGSGWWKAADAPFQCLAACMDITAALEHPGGPENYISHLTVHQDGSCNGLQHYAALGGDVEGAREVNLAAADKPQDVYSRVLEIVRHNVAADAKTKDVAALVLPHLTRKVVKQTVMTHVYGVTFVGAREQIANRLNELSEFPSEMVHKTAAYVAGRVLGAVRQLFESAHEIQDWLGENATRITRSIVVDNEDHSDKKFMSAVIWTTPLGLPIVQPYRQEKRRQVTTELQTVYITDPYAFQGVNPRKQRMAFPPNYIHSLDATHMLMSALACSKSGIDFASVHDSYWTHAGSIDTMSTALRECFVELHSDDLISKLRTEFQQRYGRHLQVVDIPLDSEVGEKIVRLRHEAFPHLRGVKSLGIQDQVQMEVQALKAEPENLSSSAMETTPEVDGAKSVTPLQLIRELGSDMLDELISKAAASKPKAQRQVTRSTEHIGTGLDTAEDDEFEEEAGDAGDAGEVRATRRRTVSALAPLYIPEIPKKGTFDVRQVLDSPYFFS